jgi:hypothetical protein
MSAPNESGPIPVSVANWPDIKRHSSTVLRTYVVDPTGATGDGKGVQIATYEPSRVRMTIRPLDSSVVLLTDPPKVSPDTSAAGVAPAQQGAVLPANASARSEEFYGPDAFWINSLTTITRVTVVKEYSTNGRA